MTYEDFIAAVQQRSGGIPREQAERVTKATLQTLAERITAGEAVDLAAQLPKALKDDLHKQRPQAEAFGLQEFVDRVAQRVGERPSDAREHVRAVLTTVREAVSGGEFEDIMQQLPDEFWQVVEPTTWRGGPLPGQAQAGAGQQSGTAAGTQAPPPPA